MTPQPEQFTVVDAQIAKWATQLQADDLAVQEQARKKINSWLDTRLALMRGEEEQCATPSPRHS